MASGSALASSVIILISFVFSFSQAKEFLVGGKTNSWQIPSFPSQSLNKWAEQNRFHLGDSLVWKFDNEKDSVLQVTREDYERCNVSNPLVAHKGGNVTVKLDQSGPFYFISGVKGRCEKGEKLVIVVMSTGQGGGFFPMSPAPSPSSGMDGRVIAPTSGAPCLAVLSGFVGVMVVSMGSFLGMIL